MSTTTAAPETTAEPQSTAVPESTATVQDRSTEFVAVEGGGETASASGLLVTAYAIMWVLVFLFVWFTAKRQRNLDSRLNEIEAGLARFDARAHDRL